MNRCIVLNEILQEHVSSQPPDTQRISKSLIKGQGHVFLAFFGVRDAVATRVQYLALSKA